MKPYASKRPLHARIVRLRDEVLRPDVPRCRLRKGTPGLAKRLKAGHKPFEDRRR